MLSSTMIATDKDNIKHIAQIVFAINDTIQYPVVTFYRAFTGTFFYIVRQHKEAICKNEQQETTDDKELYQSVEYQQ